MAHSRADLAKCGQLYFLWTDIFTPKSTTHYLTFPFDHIWKRCKVNINAMFIANLQSASSLRSSSRDFMFSQFKMGFRGVRYTPQSCLRLCLWSHKAEPRIRSGKCTPSVRAARREARTLVLHFLRCLRGVLHLNPYKTTFFSFESSLPAGCSSSIGVITCETKLFEHMSSTPSWATSYIQLKYSLVCFRALLSGKRSSDL